MGTNVYMRRIPTAAQKEELKGLLKKQYEEAIESIDRDEGLHPAREDWRLADEIEKARNRIYEEVHIGKSSYGWRFLFAPVQSRSASAGTYPPANSADPDSSLNEKMPWPERSRHP